MPATSRRNRRTLLRDSLALAGLGLVAACGFLPPQAQPTPRRATLPVIGWLGPGATPLESQRFLEGLKTYGYIPGQNITFECKCPAVESDAPLPQLAAELVQLGVDVIVARNSPAAVAAKQATATIPIVMATSGDPVTLGLVASLAQPGGNVTGLTSLSPQLSGKRLELLKEIVPGLGRLGVLWNPDDPDQAPELRETQAAATALRVQLQPLEVRGDVDLERAATAAANAQLDALLVLESPVTNYSRARLVGLARQSRLPAISGARAFTANGGLLSYGPSEDAMQRRSAYYVDRILKGARPADLPIEQPTTFALVINLKTAQDLGLTIPQAVLQQATAIIE